MAPLEDLLDWCLEAVAPEMSGARDEALELRHAGADPLELRALAFRLSQGQERSPSMLRFLVDLPAVKGGHMPLQAAWLAFRIFRTALLTSACFPEPPEPRQDMTDRLLLLCGLVLDPPSFREAVVTEDAEPLHPANAIQRLGGRTEVALRLQRLLENRTRPLARLPVEGAGRGSFEFLSVAAAAEAGLSMFDDRALSADELLHFEQVQSDRGSGILHLLAMASRADGSVAADENRVIRVIQECLGIPEDLGADLRPDPTAQELRDLFPTEEERAGLVGALAMVIAADGDIDPREETMCRVVGMALGVPRGRVDDLLERARQVAESGG